MLKIGYLFRGFLGDKKFDSNWNEVSSPDGNATYSWSLEHECNRRNWKLIPLGENLDSPGAEKLGPSIFSAFSQQKRLHSFERMLNVGWTKMSDKLFPELDAVLIEWRWPIPGRNTPEDRGNTYYQNDLDRQNEVLRHYTDLGVPIILWDLDHKIKIEDVEKWPDATIIETSIKPRSLRRSKKRISVEPPFETKDLLQHKINTRMPSYHLGYIGSRYERDETIDKWIKPISPQNTHRVKFWGKWEPEAEVKERWPGILFADRIGVSGFYDAYSKVAVVPILGKQSYYSSGFITPRPWEAVLFGSIPVGLNEHLGIENYVESIANSPEDLLEYGTRLRSISPVRREIMREEVAHKLCRCDAKFFIDTIERVVNGNAMANEAADANDTDTETKKESDDRTDVKE